MMHALKGVGILEKDTNGDVTEWCYPNLGGEDPQIILPVLKRRSGLLDPENSVANKTISTTPHFRYSRFGTQYSLWHYMYTAPVRNDSNPKVTSACVFILANTFNPKQYGELVALLHNIYAANLSSADVLTGYLAAFTKGKIKSMGNIQHISNSNSSSVKSNYSSSNDGNNNNNNSSNNNNNKKGHGSQSSQRNTIKDQHQYVNTVTSFDSTKFDQRRALIGPIKRVFELVGVECILIWVAVLLKKRIFVYCDNLKDLLSVVKTIPLIGGWHRQHWHILRPYVCMNETELGDLKSAGYYIAGFTDSACKSKTSMYDLFVDIPARSVSIAPHCQKDFVLTRFHKQTADFFMKVSSSDNQDIIKSVALKTTDLLKNLSSLKTEHDDGTYITLEELSERKLPPNTDRFLYNVALSEGMTKQ